jgi:hypothetical protein
MNGIDHERCSELLGPHLRGELDAGEARSVADHLASCTECRDERRALEALLSGGPEEPEGLTDVDRARLHRSVWDEVRPEPARPKRSLGSRLAPFVGAAALVALIAVGIVSGGTGGDDADGGGESGSADMSTEISGNDSGATGGEEPAAEESEARNGDEEVTDAVEEETNLSAADPGSSPYFEQEAGIFSQARFRLIGRGGPFTNYAEKFDAARATEIQADYFGLLERAAPPEVGDVRPCAERAAAEFGNTALAGYGGTGTYEGAAALVLGFAYSSNAEDVDTWGFAILDESDCRRIIEVFSGRIGR